ncbi:MAG: pyridoxamine 5'-phosphate oxidase family protein [Acidimicrobiales bacterium]
MRAAAAQRAFVTATLYEGVRLARRGFESSIAYRSVSVVGPASFVEDEARRRPLLDRFVDAVVPGRSREVRPTRDEEVRRTAVLEVRIEEAAVKVSAGPTDDDDEDDRGLAIWAGLVPVVMRYGEPQRFDDGGDPALEVPLSVRRLLGLA